MLQVITQKVTEISNGVMRKSWFRNGIEIMAQNSPNNKGISICLLSPVNLKVGRAALVIRLNNQNITSISNGPALNGLQFSIMDFNEDFIPDTIQFYSPSENKLIEAYNITRGTIEPIPYSLFKEDGSEFYFDAELIKFINSKLNQK